MTRQEYNDYQARVKAFFECEGIAAEDDERVAQMTTAYIECALWSSTDESDDSGGEPLDRNYSTADITRITQLNMQADCRRFYEQHKADLERFVELFAARRTRKEAEDRRKWLGLDDQFYWEECGHCFWLSRNGHGAGFFDRFDHRDSAEARALGDRLQVAAAAFGEAHLMVGDDGEIYYFTG